MRAPLLAVLLSSTLALSALGAIASAPSARAEARDDVLGQLTNDVQAVTVGLPIWMSQHLPAMMAETGTGAGINLSDDAGGFSIGLIPLRLGFMNQFNDVGKGTQLVEFDKVLPGNFPWPQFGAVLGIGLGNGFELGADFQFLPKMDLAASDNVDVSVGLFSIGGSLRWRLNDANGVVPAFVLGVGGSYYQGFLAAGGGYAGPYSYDTQAGPATGTFSFAGAPRVEWNLAQVNVELRTGWKLGVIRPYMGLGLGMTFGDAVGSAQVRAQATIDNVAGQDVNQQPVFFEDRSFRFSSPAAKWTFRPHVGLDLVLGPIAITTQLDLAVMNQERVSADVQGAAGSFDPSENILYNEASRSSQTSAALVGTVAIRFQSW